MLKIDKNINQILDNLLFELEEISHKRGLQQNAFESGVNSGMSRILFHLRNKIEQIKKGQG